MHKAILRRLIRNLEQRMHTKKVVYHQKK